MTYRLQFTEKMIGAFTFGETDYHAGYRRAQTAVALMFRLTISTDDVDAFVADPRHLAVPPGLRRLATSRGPPARWRPGPSTSSSTKAPAPGTCCTGCTSADATGRPLTLAGYKDVRPGPITKVWPETSTLYTRILAGHVPVTDGGAPRPRDRRLGHPAHPAARLRPAAHHLSGTRPRPDGRAARASTPSAGSFSMSCGRCSIRCATGRSPCLISATSSSPTCTSGPRTAS